MGSGLIWLKIRMIASFPLFWVISPCMVISVFRRFRILWFPVTSASESNSVTLKMEAAFSPESSEQNYRKCIITLKDVIWEAPPYKLEKVLNSSDVGPFSLLRITGTLPVTHSHLLQLAQKAVMQPQSHRTVLVRYPGHMSQTLLIIMIEAFGIRISRRTWPCLSLSRSVHIHHSFPLHSPSYMLVSRSSAVK